MSNASNTPLFDYAEKQPRVAFGGEHAPPRRLRGPQPWRLAAVSACFALAFTAVAGKLVLNAAPRTVSPAIAAQMPDGGMRELAPRASILDRNGEILAYSLPFASMYANPQEVRHPKRAVERLLKVMPDLDAENLIEGLSNQSREFVYVARHLTPQQHAAALELGLPGFYFREEYKRIYPHGRLAVHSVGTVQSDHRGGMSGIEAFYDADLVSDPDLPVRLSIDLRAQAIVREEMQKAIDRFEAIGGMGVMIDVTTGEVLASVSLPDFDPNQLSTISEDTQTNKVVGGRYELGSMFKLITASVALETGVASVNSQFDATKPIRMYGKTISDFRGEHRWLSMREVLVHSSNIGAARMAEKIGTETLVDYFGRFGLLERANIELRESASPLYPEVWRDINAMTASFGHGISVTPVQFIAAVGALANGGILYRPTMERLVDGAKTAGRRVISAETSAKVRDLMRAVVVEGSGKAANSRFYEVGGKTGTALKVVDGKYSDEKRLSSFVGVFPMQSPRYAVMVSIDEPKGRKDTLGFATGGWVAAPAVGQIIDRVAPMLGVPKKRSNDGKDGALRTASVRIAR